MSESLSLLSEVGGGGGGGGGEGGGVIDVVVPTEFWSTELALPSVVESSSTYSRLMSTSIVDGPLQFLFVGLIVRFLLKMYLEWGGTPSCVGKRKWILRREVVA